jgi:uncharacterized protein YjdB
MAISGGEVISSVRTESRLASMQWQWPTRSIQDILFVMKSLRRWCLALSGIVLAMGCGGGEPTATSRGVVSTPLLTVVNVIVAPETIVLGETAQASVAGLDQNGVGIVVGTPVWSSTSPATATVSESGVINAVAVGQTTLIATVGGKQGQRTVTVIPPPITRIAIDPAPFRLLRGTALQLHATAFDVKARELTDRKIVFASSDPAKATVTADGLVTAVAAGTATIVATGERITAASALTVTTTPDSVATVTVSPAVKVLKIGETVQLAATLRDSTDHVLAPRPVEWVVSGAPGHDAATVSPTGLVTAVATGTVIVEAFSEGQHGSVTIIIGDNVDENIVVSFAAPVENELVGDSLIIRVGVQSSRPLTIVTASVGSLRVTLVPTPVGALGLGTLWGGTIDLTDLPTGPYQVLATATDITGAHGLGSRQFQRDTRTGKGGSGSQPKQK